MIIFDKDGTLISMVGNRPANFPSEQILLPGRQEKIATLKAAGNKIAVVSNQWGVAFGLITLQQAQALMEDCATKIGADAWEMCPHHPKAGCDCHKPEPGMLLALMKRFGVSPRQTLFVGDRPEDAKAAKAAGISFIWADQFFYRPAREEKRK